MYVRRCVGGPSDNVIWGPGVLSWGRTLSRTYVRVCMCVHAVHIWRVELGTLRWLSEFVGFYKIERNSVACNRLVMSLDLSVFSERLFLVRLLQAELYTPI